LRGLSSHHHVAATAAIVQIPHLCDLARRVPTTHDQFLRLPSEGCVTPAAEATRAVLLSHLHGLVINNVLGGVEAVGPVEAEQLLGESDL
jgi:hypothetical protein